MENELCTPKHSTDGARSKTCCEHRRVTLLSGGHCNVTLHDITRVITRRSMAELKWVESGTERL